MTNQNLTDFYPQFFPIQWINEYDIFGAPFTEDVAVGYVKRELNGYSYLLKNDFVEIGTTQDTLLDRSLKNLDKISATIQLLIARPGNFCEITWQAENDNFSAIRLLLPRIQKVIVENMGNNFLFTIPSRDIITCWSTDAPIEWTLKNYKDSEDIFKEDDYRLSPKVVRFDSIWPLNFYNIELKK
jgi:hypothetical protein